MKLLGVALAVVLTWSLGAAPAQAGRPDWQGSAHAMPSRYQWLDDLTPLDTYTIVLVRGLTERKALRSLGGVHRDLGDRTPGAAERYLFDHMDTHGEYDWPPVVQVQRRGHAVMVYAPYGVLKEGRLAKLSRKGVATEFFTDVELDTYITVAEDGEAIRFIDAMFGEPGPGKLAEERGLWPRHGRGIFATAWAFNERVALTHLSKRWFMSEHPTYVLRRSGALG